METVPDREEPSLLGKGTLLVSCPRNCTKRVETMLDREVETWSDGVEHGAPSNVTVRAEVITNPGRSIASATSQAVPRTGSKVFQKQQTGRVVQVEVVRL